jgi:threonyl-tRNA synthetase
METATEKDELYRIRHSLAHVMAQAVLELRPGSTLGFGPPIDDGFDYDFILSEPLNEEDFPSHRENDEAYHQKRSGL